MASVIKRYCYYLCSTSGVRMQGTRVFSSIDCHLGGSKSIFNLNRASFSRKRANILYCNTFLDACKHKCTCLIKIKSVYIEFFRGLWQNLSEDPHLPKHTYVSKYYYSICISQARWLSCPRTTSVAPPATSPRKSSSPSWRRPLTKALPSTKSSTSSCWRTSRAAMLRGVVSSTQWPSTSWSRTPQPPPGDLASLLRHLISTRVTR